MNIFPSLFSSVVGFCHLYLFWNLCRGFGGGWWRLFAAAGLLAAYMAILFRSRIAVMPHGPTLASLVFLWVGFMLIITMWTGARDIAHLSAWILDRLAGTDWARYFTVTKTIPIALALGLLAFGYALYEARTVRVSRLTAKAATLPEGREKVRIAAFSDTHLLRGTSAERLRKLVDLVNAQKPDVVLALGDIVDDDLRSQNRLSDELQRLEAPLGKFAVLGNHEYYRGLGQAVDFLERSGFTLLRGRTIEAGGISITGVDDPAIPGRLGIADALRGAERDSFVLLAAHRPETPPDAAGLFDLQLSGHTHGGQIWPLRYFTWMVHGHRQGLSVVSKPADGTGKTGLLYLGNGTGYWGPPVRFLAPPEIIVVDVTR